MNHTQSTPYTLKLAVNKNTSSLSLWRGEQRARTLEWQEERDMGKQLLCAIRNILADEGIESAAVKSFLVEGDAPENFTSRRIAETVSRVYTFSINQK